MFRDDLDFVDEVGPSDKVSNWKKRCIKSRLLVETTTGKEGELVNFCSF